MLQDVQTSTAPLQLSAVGFSHLPHCALSTMLAEARAAVANDPRTAIAVLARASALLDGGWTEPAAMDERPDPAPRGRLAPWQAKRVRQHIAANLSSSISLHDLAEVSRLSTSHFARAFRATFGEPPHAYVMRQRIDHAVTLMSSTDEPLAQIAVECGLADQSHLTRLFKRYMGTTPKAWRRSQAAAPSNARSVRPLETRAAA